MTSKFDKMSKKNLKKILSLMDDSIERSGNPRQVIDYRNDRAIVEALSIIGLEINKIDMNFLTQLRIENPNFETEEIKIPTLKLVEVRTERQAIVRVNEVWEHEVNSYIDEDDLGRFLEDMSENEWWEGVKVDEDIYDEETTSSEIVEINRIK
jgi:hypothetical protein